MKSTLSPIQGQKLKRHIAALGTLVLLAGILLTTSTTESISGIVNSYSKVTEVAIIAAIALMPINHAGMITQVCESRSAQYSG